MVLGIETSCDDTSVAIVELSGRVIALCSANQDLAHRPFGGVVPEIASRNHTLQILPLVDECLRKSKITWAQLSGIAVTNRPGLLGSLLVGVVTAKTLALAKNLPFVGVNHLEAHLLAGFLVDEQFQAPNLFCFPFLALAVSGGHTQLYVARKFGEYEVLGRTLDDAAGEAFDKFAKMIGINFPGGPVVDRLSQGGDPNAFHFPRPLSGQFNFSFSGLKTSALRLISTMSGSELESHKASLCASFQEAVVDSLLEKLEMAVKKTGIKTMTITGGVSANSRLRQKATELADMNDWTLVIPPIRYCTDNAAMVAYVGAQRMSRGEFSNQELAPLARAMPNDPV